MSRSDPQMKIRVPHDLKDWINRKAKDGLRTKNAQIVRILTRAMIEDEVTKKAPEPRLGNRSDASDSE